MSLEATAYLVVRLDDGFGDVFPLSPDVRYRLGRGNTSRIVLRDDLCSREHAEVYFAEDRWWVRDLESLNGTRVNGEKLDSEWELAPKDEIRVGRTCLLFVEDISQLPDLPVFAASENLTIKKRLSQSRFLTPVALAANLAPAAQAAKTRHELNRDLALLYRLALDMGSAGTYQELIRLVLQGLLDAIPADAGAILTRKETGELELTEHRHRDPTVQGYIKASQFLSNEVLASKEAILAEDVTRDPALNNRKSIQEAGASSLICAPFTFNDQVLGLIHLYGLNSTNTLDSEDLEFVVAVARQLGAAVHQLQKQASLRAENRSLRDQLRVESELVGNSPAIEGVVKKIALVADTHATVLIRGESGTGKELVARAIHYSSNRKEGPFICLNCAALPDALMESELFGHEKGAFTGATEKKIGKFEAANKGTIFLDEIGELNPATQAKLLRVLEGHPFERVGGHSLVRVDVRVVAATNQPLEQAIKAGAFRRDLFFRLQVVEIVVPPLRERSADVPLLAQHFLKRFVHETGRKIAGLTTDAVKKLEEYQWPGNVRELRNVIERAVALGSGPVLDAPDIWLSALDLGGVAAAGSNSSPAFQPMSIEDIEKQHIVRTLQHTNWNKSQAASILHIERSTLDRKIKSYDLKRET
jgi:Nif-specific regulatory protein